jgi:molecular chaperone Hsp33
VDSEDTPSSDPFSQIELRSYFVRKRNALLVRGQFTDLFVDYYLHLAQNNLVLTSYQDSSLKDGLVAMTLHLASRPWNEHHAWSIHIQNPTLNLFLCGDNATSRVTGRAFSKEVTSSTDRNMMAAQMQRKGMTEPRSSMVEIGAEGMFRAIEHFYAQSEQRTARIFELDDENYVFITAQPQCDLDWLNELTVAAVRDLDQYEELSLLEQRSYHFECGCDLRRIWDVLLPHCINGVADLFGLDEFLQVGCRRCGAEYRIQREQFEAYWQSRKVESQPNG